MQRRAFAFVGVSESVSTLLTQEGVVSGAVPNAFPADTALFDAHVKNEPISWGVYRLPNVVTCSYTHFLWSPSV